MENNTGQLKRKIREKNREVKLLRADIDDSKELHAIIYLYREGQR